MPDTPLSRSLHGPLIERSLPAWVSGATSQRRAALKQAGAPVPDWYKHATPAQRQALHAAAVASATAQTDLDKAVAALQDVDAFAAPLLVKALKDQFNVTLDVHTTLLCLKKPLSVSVFKWELGHFDVLRMPMLQAALHNFEEEEGLEGAFHASSGFLSQAESGKEQVVSTALTAMQFIRLCRELDIGAQYQAYLKAFLYPADTARQRALRDPFCAAQKAALAAAAQLALLKNDIDADDFAMVMSVVNGNHQPSLRGKRVWLRDLTLMRHRMTGCVMFVISEKYRYSEDLILYIPNDPDTPLKRHAWAELDARFKQRFTLRDAKDPVDGSPSAYQRFFSQFVAYADRPDYFSQLTVPASGINGDDVLESAGRWSNEALKWVGLFGSLTVFNELPPSSAKPRVPNPDPFLHPRSAPQIGSGLWLDNLDLWQYLFDRHRDRLIADARSHAVPTADVDARVRAAKFASLFNIGMLVLNGVAMLVPVLGEVMMVVMAGQLLYETFEGVIDWAEGDRQAAKAHLLDVAENVALLAAMAGAGKGLAKLAAVKAQPMIEALEPVTSVDGKVRLWKPDLGAYESPVDVPPQAAPDALGQYHRDGKTYIRQAGKCYETTFDETAQRWRIKHPSDHQAYQPPLHHNGAGAWRHVHERPLAWDRPTLLRRMGHVTDAYTDEQLLIIGQVSGLDDNALRQMHMDNTPPPAALADTLRLFEADRGVARMIEQVQAGQALDERYLSILSLVPQLPRWPQGRVLEVFEAASLEGPSLKYAPEGRVLRARRKPSIRLSRADVLEGQLSTRILAALDEREITQLLGDEGARVQAHRPHVLRQQIADYARTRQPTIFESLYRGPASQVREVARLQRLYPGLGESAAQDVLFNADAEQLKRMQSPGRLPLSMQESARWHVRQGRLRHAYAGLYMDNLACADSQRLALHTLAKLPGWSDDVRLEMREGHVGGERLDAIGDEAASSRQYLVKKGPYFQAYDEQGEALNSLAGDSDNFFASIMHALPDHARQALGVPHVGQSGQLRRLIIDRAFQSPLESARIVEGRSLRRSWFKPPRRLASGRVGYPASGRGAGVMPSLTSRVQQVYPQLNEEQATGFIRQRMQAGDSDQQIFNLLNNRLREWQTLEATLDAWAIQDPRRSGTFQVYGGRDMAAQAIKRSWRASPLPALSGVADLDVFCDEALPPLEADFSHVRYLKFGGMGFNDHNIEQFLGHFPEVVKLQVGVAHPQLRNVLEVVGRQTQLTYLRMVSNFSFEAPQRLHLGNLAALEELDLSGVLPSGQVLDVSRLRQLRRLTLSRGYDQPGLPTGVLDLPLLERLDLRQVGVRSLPPRLFEAGNERLWRGLSLNWSLLDEESFKSAYSYLQRQAQPLVDLDEMVAGYCKGQVSRLHEMLYYDLDQDSSFSRSTLMEALTQAFFQRWTSASERFQAMDALSARREQLVRHLDTWATGPMPPEEVVPRMRTARALKDSWYKGVLQHYGVVSDVPALHLPSMRLSELPALAREDFPHIRTLNLSGSVLPVDALPGFLHTFGGLRTLNLSDCSLAQLPLAGSDWAALEHLDLSRNPLERLDVSAMSQLQALDLSHTPLSTWPTGIQNLADLGWLNLGNTRLDSVPSGVLASDALVLATHLQDVPLTAEARAELALARQRVGQGLGLADGTLNRFAQEPFAAQFPPTETAPTIARQVLPLLAPGPVDAGLSLEGRVRRLWPDLDADAPQAWLTRLRSEGVSDEHIQVLLGEWEGHFNQMARGLNDWIFIREQRGTGWIISAQTRRQAALRLLDAWREGLGIRRLVAEPTLSLDGLQVGDLPDPGVSLAHIEHLNLAGVRLRAQGSNDFLRAFPQARTLNLNGNHLDAVPTVVAGMSRLERLELSGNELADPAPLYSTLEGLPNLQWLDLSHTDLETFRVSGFARLQTLDLSSTRLEVWPEGALQSTSLRTLNLRSNGILDIPVDLLDGNHERLIAGTDMADNIDLSPESLERIQDYTARRGLTGALGMSNAEIDGLLREDVGVDEDVLSDEVLPDVPPSPGQDGAWLAGLSFSEMGEFRGCWRQLAEEPDGAAFFHLLERLQDTAEYRLARSDLSRRVYQVVKAAAEDGELRGLLFGMSSTHGTCVDGRMLTFSNLEVKVFEYAAIEGLDPMRLDLRGAALLKLSRQLFRLDRVEALANRVARPGTDPAEIRLEYRIGLRQPLDLPGQPAYMSFGRPIDGNTLVQAEQSVRAAERSDAFYEYLITLDHWVNYLNEKYPQDFAELAANEAQKKEALEIAHAEIDDQYSRAANLLDIELSTQRNQRLLALSRLETEAEHSLPHEPQPGPSRGATRQ